MEAGSQHHWKTGAVAVLGAEIKANEFITLFKNAGWEKTVLCIKYVFYKKYKKYIFSTDSNYKLFIYQPQRNLNDWSTVITLGILSYIIALTVTYCLATLQNCNVCVCVLFVIAWVCVPFHIFIVYLIVYVLLFKVFISDIVFCNNFIHINMQYIMYNI